MVKLLSLFSGIGAFEKALDRVGVDYDLVNYCEIDKHASCAYAAIHNEPEDKNLWDVTTIDPETLPHIGMITHGSPCQDFSVAGNMAGGDEGSGTRSSLMWYTVNIVRHKRPRIVVWENVKGVLSKKNRPTFTKYLDTMASLGYTNHHKVLNAKDYGVPQNRERIFVVSLLGGGSVAWPVAFDSGVRLQDILETNVPESFYLDEDKIQHFLSRIVDGKTGSLPSSDNEILVSEALSSREHRLSGWKSISGTLKARDYKDPKIVSTPGPSKLVLAGNLNHYGNNQMNAIYDPSGVSSCITVVSGGGREKKVMVGSRIRKLTPLEYWRLTGFWDNDYYTARAALMEKFYNGKDRTKSQMYKMAGNSIVVNVLEEIFKGVSPLW